MVIRFQSVERLWSSLTRYSFAKIYFVYFKSDIDSFKSQCIINLPSDNNDKNLSENIFRKDTILCFPDVKK